MGNGVGGGGAGEAPDSGILLDSFVAIATGTRTPGQARARVVSKKSRKGSEWDVQLAFK